MIWPFRSTPMPEPQPPAPAAPVWAIGDLHGCRDRLDSLLEAIEQTGATAEALVFLGDYCDRGPDSAGVLARLRTLDAPGGRTVTCLLGNHDRMLLDFLRDPVGRGPRFLDNGGQDTLLSYGVLPPARSTGAEDRLGAQARGLADAMGDMANWLAARPLWHQSGNVVFVHAQTDPDLAMAQQQEDTLLWARPPRRPRPRADGAWVVHGHTVVPDPRVQAGHIAIDTGAYRGKPLTAVRLQAGQAPRFLQV